MIITEEYLELRHAYWRKRISDAGIWNAGEFRKVRLIVRPQSKACLGKFRRKFIRARSRFLVEFEDQIIIYQQDPDIPAQATDSTLVHEMIHQYICQASLTDTSSHGKLFRSFMSRINRAFPGELEIAISAKPRILKGAGRHLHKLLLIHTSGGDCYCCRLMPSKTAFFMKMAERLKREGAVSDYALCESDDQFFDSQRSCRSRLSGRRFTPAQLQDLCRDCNIRKVRPGG